MNQGYNEEAARLAEIAVKRLNAAKIVIEYLSTKDQFDKDETRFVKQIEKNWYRLTELQKEIVFMHLIQGFSFTAISDYAGTSPQAVSQAFHRACQWFKFR